MIPYLSQFWDSITSATADSVEWFQSLGNAVAGAMGNILLYPLQVMVDFGLAIVYFVSQVWSLISIFFAPFWFVVAWATAVVNAATQTYQTSPLFSEVTADVSNFFNSLPYWSALTSVIAAGIWFAVFYSTLKAIRR